MKCLRVACASRVQVQRNRARSRARHHVDDAVGLGGGGGRMMMSFVGQLNAHADPPTTCAIIAGQNTMLASPARGSLLAVAGDLPGGLFQPFAYNTPNPDDGRQCVHDRASERMQTRRDGRARRATVQSHPQRLGAHQGVPVRVGRSVPPVCTR